MGIKIQKGDKYFGSGRAVGFAAADGGIKKTVYKNERPDSRPQEILCLIVFGRSSLGVSWEIANPGRKRGCKMRTKYEQNILFHCIYVLFLRALMLNLEIAGRSNNDRELKNGFTVSRLL